MKQFLVERIVYVILGFLIAMVLFSKGEKIEEIKIPIKIKEIKKDTVFFQDTKLINLKQLLIDSLKKEIENLKNEKITKRRWVYDDKNLNCELFYFGFMKPQKFSYIVKERDTVIKYQYKIKTQRDWKMTIISGLSGFVLGYFWRSR